MRGREELEMPEANAITTCGLVLHLGAEPELEGLVALALQAMGGCEVGRASGPWLPVAVETTDAPATQRAIEAIPGVERCEVVFIGSESGLASPAPHSPYYCHE